MTGEVKRDQTLAGGENLSNARGGCMSFQKSPFAFDLRLGSGHLLDQVVIREVCHQTHPTLKSQVFAFPGDPPPTSALV